MTERAIDHLQDQWLLILDFGSQYTQLIARRVRECGVYCEIQPFDVDESYFEERQPRGVILSGGPETVTAGDTPRIPERLFELEVPILGICYGMQALAEQLGGGVKSSAYREFGHAEIYLQGGSDFLRTLDPNRLGKAQVWMSHGDRVESLPEGFRTICTSQNSPSAAMASEDKSFYGLQFHPEVTHTICGQRIIENFLHHICGCASDWNPGNIIAKHIKKVQEAVGNDQILLGLSLSLIHI